MANGPFSVLMKLRVSRMFGEMNSRSYIHNMKEKAEQDPLLRLRSCGLQSLTVKSKQEHHIWYIRMLRTVKAISRI